MLLVVAGGLFCAWRLAVTGHGSDESDLPVMESHNRLLRSEIPAMAANSIRYRELFADNNDVQLVAAKRMGLKNPDAVKHPELCDELVKVESSSYYTVDTLYHSKPYLVPEAALLLTYISRRFDQLQDEESVTIKVRPIVTSLLRNRSQVGRLRRVNRNATENSCHLYGTTFDLSYCRFVTADGDEVFDNGQYKQLLALALYELRFEGLCYVKYERRPPCFHITVRAVDYEGELASATEKFEVGNWRLAVGSRQLAVGSEKNSQNPASASQPEESAKKQEVEKSPAPAVAENKPDNNKKEDKNKEQQRSKEFGHRSNYVFD